MNHQNTARARLATLSVLAVLATASAVAPATTQAADATWTGTSSGAWRTTGNWNPAAFPGSSTSTGNTDLVTISVSTQPTMGINFNNATTGVFSFGGISFNNGTSRVLGSSSGTAGGTLTLNGATINSVSNVISRNAGAGNFTFQALQASTMNVALGNTTSNVVVIDGAGNTVFDSVISSQSGATPLTIQGTGGGRVDITGANTFTGNVNVLGAEVRFTSNASFGNANNTIVVDGGRLATVNSGTYTLAATHGIQVGATDGTSISTPGSGVLTYNGVIANKPGSTGILVKQGGGTLALGGISTYGGDTSVNNGTLQLTGGNDRLPTGTTVNVGQAASTNLGTFDLNGQNQQLAGLNSTAGSNSGASKNTVMSTGAATLTLGGTGTYSYGAGTAANSGVITGAIAVAKTGSGTQTFGDANTYSGGTTVSGGTLLVTNSSGSGTGSAAVNVNAGTLGGTGTISGAVTVANSATIQGGIGTVLGALTLSIAPTLNATSIIQLTIDSSLNHSALALPANSDPFDANQKFTFTGNAANGTYDNIITGVASGINTSNWTITNGFNAYSFVDDGSNIDLVITDVPEPTTIFGGVLMLGALGWNQRRPLRGLAGAMRRKLAA